MSLIKKRRVLIVFALTGALIVGGAAMDKKEASAAEQVQINMEKSTSQFNVKLGSKRIFHLVLIPMIISRIVNTMTMLLSLELLPCRSWKICLKPLKTTD